MKRAIFAVFFLVAGMGHSFGLSCRPPGSPTVEFAKANSVVIGKLLSIRQSSWHDSAGRGYPGLVIENDIFRVLKSWKGAKQGEAIRVRSNVGISGISAKNSPMWLKEMPPHGAAGFPAKISDEWLIYGYGSQPYELSLCRRSLPMNLVKPSEIQELNRAAKRTP